ncbi:unnamed protein product [Rotaria sordida]|uniref:Uncharacterized protein n=1 Tax=Rotaria sordida TaxID=392033 RepID=A0A814KN95_9BILA|nr:unnamed protein product [Rotaria sordida]CAF1053632.1 unnamed protein product [Rotaria sordida]CAF3675032.1 unnamed protein product [Rotaria sordida]CAF3743823.1 unnamed protein product [Rotaria sordida]
MILSILFGIIVAVCLVSTLIFYVFIRSRENLRSSSMTSITGKQQIKYSLRPSFDTITKILNQDFSFRTSFSSGNRSSSTINDSEYNDFDSKKQHRSVESINVPITPLRSTSMVATLFQTPRSCISNRRQGSIVDATQMALIPFSLPIRNNNNDKYRRRSVAVCNNIIEPRENIITTNNLTLPCLLSFSIIYLKTSQIKIQFHSIQSLPLNIHFQQLTIKVKLTPDGKEKSIQIKKIIENQIIFEDENNQFFLLFSNIPFEKLNERILSMTISGKDQTKKTIHIGQIGKIHFNQINQFENENRVEFLHAIEKIKPSSIELLISLEKNDDDQYIHVGLQRIKGLKIDQKKFDAKCYLQIILLDRHRSLLTQQTKTYRLQSSNFIIDQEHNFNIVTYNSNNFDRLMIMFNLYSNANHTNEYKCIGHVKIGSPLLCSGNGTIHWQQFKARKSFSMWHTLNKEQH